MEYDCGTLVEKMLTRAHQNTRRNNHSLCYFVHNKISSGLSGIKSRFPGERLGTKHQFHGNTIYYELLTEIVNSPGSGNFCSLSVIHCINPTERFFFHLHQGL